MTDSSVKTALVIRLSSLGDIVLTQPILEQLQAAGYAVDLIVQPDYAALGKLLPGATRVLSAPADLKSKYDLLLDLHGTLRARRLADVVPAGRKIRYRKRALARRLLLRLGGRRLPWNALSGLKPEQQVTAWYAEALRQAGVVPHAAQPRLDLPEWIVMAADKTLRAAKLKKDTRFAVLAPGAKWPTKEWPEEYFAELAHQLDAQLGLVPVFIGSGQERDKCENIAAQCGGRAKSLAGLTNLPTLAAILAQAEILVSNDSGPLHLGLAAGTRAVGLFGPTVSHFGFTPIRHPRAMVLENPLPCRPCSLHGGLKCPLGHHDCLRRITPGAVLQAVRSMAHNRPPKTKQA